MERFKPLNCFSMSSWTLSPNNLSSSSSTNDDVDPDTIITTNNTTPTANTTTQMTTDVITNTIDNHPSLCSETIRKQIMKIKKQENKIKAQRNGKWINNISSPQEVVKDGEVVPLPNFALSNGNDDGGGDSTNTNRNMSMTECILLYSRIIRNMIIIIIIIAPQ